MQIEDLNDIEEIQDDWSFPSGKLNKSNPKVVIQILKIIEEKIQILKIFEEKIFIMNCQLSPPSKFKAIIKELGEHKVSFDSERIQKDRRNFHSNMKAWWMQKTWKIHFFSHSLI